MSKIKVLAGLVSSQSTFLGLQMVTLSLSPHTAFPLVINIPAVSMCVQISSSHKDATQIGLGAILFTSF